MSWDLDVLRYNNAVPALVPPDCLLSDIYVYGSITHWGEVITLSSS